MGCFNHRYIVGSVPNRKSYFVKISPYYSNYFSFLDGEQAATDYCIAEFCKVSQFSFIQGIPNNWGQVLTFNQKGFCSSRLIELLGS